MRKNFLITGGAINNLIISILFGLSLVKILEIIKEISFRPNLLEILLLLFCSSQFYSYLPRLVQKKIMFMHDSFIYISK